jgi:hypothetical protein
MNEYNASSTNISAAVSNYGNVVSKDALAELGESNMATDECTTSESPLSYDDEAMEQLLQNPNFYEKLKSKVERREADLREKNKEEIAKLEEKQKQIAEKLRVLKGSSSSNEKRSYREFSNPSNPTEVYKTGKYKDWMYELASNEGIEARKSDDKPTEAMKEWVRSKLR